MHSSSESEYLERERHSDVKHELVNGGLVAMAVASFNHALIATNIAGTLRQRLADRPCRVLGSDLRVNVAETRLYTHPDVTVICGKPEIHAQDGGTLRNPTILVEVLSESTESYDRGAKFAHYQNLPSLREYLLVSQDERSVERYERVEGGSWLYTKFTGGAVVPLPAAETELPLDEVYSKVEFPVEAASDASEAR